MSAPVATGGTVRKKVDSRIRTLIENGVKARHRTMFVIIGDRGRDQVANLHYILSKSMVRTRPSVLWCYKKDLGFTTHQEKRRKKIQREVARGMRQQDELSPFELFVSSTDIRYCYYKESHRILGNTYGMCVLQDFQALTPNLLARTIETVEGGGIVVLLIKTLDSLKQLYTMAMDVHSRYRTESHQDVVGRFNERFLLSLGPCQASLVLDDELNLLPISSHAKHIKKEADATAAAGTDEQQQGPDAELAELKVTMKDTQPVGALIECCRTLDQAKAVLTFSEAVMEKTLRSTVVLTAARGRGKSAALGLAMAGAVAAGYSNIFVTAPSPENLKTLFEMVVKGFDALEYKEHQDYELVQSTNPDFNKAIVRINVFHGHRQTIQYISPQDAGRLSHCELLVIDEAAAIPLPMVEKLLGPYLVFMSSTINGYEGTGRSLSLKLVKQLRQQNAREGRTEVKTAGGRVLREMTLEQPIRYASGDPIEKWLNDLLCLDCTAHTPRLVGGLPHPSQCDLYHVNRDTLFSFHKASEEFLQRMMALYVSSHYKNTPNDLQLLSDAPAHHLFVLLGPVDARAKKPTLPDIYVVVQVCLEGEISKEAMQRSVARGLKASGDLIPWTVAQQFQNNEFAQLSGARIVRIATHPDAQRKGYGKRALDLLSAYYEGKLTNLSEVEESLGRQGDEGKNRVRFDRAGEDGKGYDKGKGKGKGKDAASGDDGSSAELLGEEVAPRSDLPPLLTPLAERRPEELHWLGVSFGLTQELYDFWRKGGFSPVYLRLTQNETTGEHSAILLKAQKGVALKTVGTTAWLDVFAADFRRRFLSLLSYDFRAFAAGLALSLALPPDPAARKKHAAKADSEPVDMEEGDDDEAKQHEQQPREGQVLSAGELKLLFTPWDLKRLESYARNLVDYHLILDLVPALAMLHFSKRLGSDFSLSYVQGAILLALGLQKKSVSDIERELKIGSTQILALFNKSVRKIHGVLRAVEEAEVKQAVAGAGAGQGAAAAGAGRAALNETLDSELRKSSAKAKKDLQDKQRKALESLDLAKYAIRGSDEDWEAAVGSAAPGSAPSTVSVKGSAKPAASSKPSGKDAKGKKRRRDEGAGDEEAPAAGGGGAGSRKASKRAKS